MVILGSDGQDRETRASNPLAVIALVCQPILIASGVIFMRQMRKMPETTASFYKNLTLAVFSAEWTTYERESFNFMNDFSV
jgi:hypothetical protein